MVLRNIVKHHPRLRQFLRSSKTKYLKLRYGLKNVDSTFFIHTPIFRISRDFKTGKFGLIGYHCNICPKVEFGNYVLVAPEVRFIGGDHVSDNPNKPVLFCGRPAMPKTMVGHDVWIGRNVVILAGVTIENGAIVAAGSVVTKNVREYTVVGGVPAKFIKKRFLSDSDVEIHKTMLAQQPRMWDNYPM